LNTQEDCPNIINCGPLVFQDIEAYISILINVRMKTRRFKSYSRRCVRIVRGKLNGQLENKRFIGLKKRREEGEATKVHE
jgi:hypothetical protein